MFTPLAAYAKPFQQCITELTLVTCSKFTDPKMLFLLMCVWCALVSRLTAISSCTLRWLEGIQVASSPPWSSCNELAHEIWRFSFIFLFLFIVEVIVLWALEETKFAGFGFFGWRNYPPFKQRSYSFTDLWDRIECLASLWAKAHNFFRTIPLSTIQRDWVTILYFSCIDSSLFVSVLMFVFFCFFFFGR